MSAGAALDRRPAVPIERIGVSVYTIPTPEPESDGTAEWSSTTMLLVELEAGGERGTGWSYGSPATAEIVREHFAPLVRGADVHAVRELWTRLAGVMRNPGRNGMASYALGAVDVAMWDLRARILGIPLCDLIGRVRDRVPVYGSGGFTSLDLGALHEQCRAWAAAGMRMVKIKVGRDHASDVDRVRVAREAIGPRCALMIDANGGYDAAGAIGFAHRIAAYDVCWFEQPVDPRDHDGMRRVRAALPPGMALSSGEYITDTADAAAVAGAVDVLQADATRCGGYTGLLAIDGFCEVRRLPLSTHCAPALHVHAALGCLQLRHIEWFVDHVRIESELFDGFPKPHDGTVAPDRSRPGHGLTFRRDRAARYAVEE
jgi:L-alanine-DL-glutamate epimerase-like enolase superfamily enzyme